MKNIDVVTSEKMTTENSFAKKITFQAIIIVLLAACFYLYEFYMQVAPGAMQQDLMRDFAIDATKFGLLSGCFYLSYTPLQLLAGLLLDRYSTRVILTCICTTFAFGVLLFAHASSIYMAAIARFIMGGAASCAFISVLHLTARWVPPIHFALFVGIAEMMGAIGGYGGTEHVAMLLKYFDWRTTITGFAYLGFILAILIALIVRNQPAIHKNVQTQTNNHSVWFDLKTILHNRETWTIGIYSFLIWAPILSLGLWGTEFIHLSRGLEKTVAAHTVAFMWLGVALASPVIGWFSDLIGRRCIIMTICALAGTIATIIVIFFTNISTNTLYPLMFLIGFASAGQTLSFALVKDNNSPYTNGVANGFNNMVVVAGGLLFQPLIGKILDMCWQGTTHNGVHIYSFFSYQTAFSVLAICYFVAAIVSIFFIRETRCIAVWQKQKEIHK